MRKIVLLSLIIISTLANITAQNSYWVVFTDKQNTVFDPYQYFDNKAIERYKLNNADIYDITNYPVNEKYSSVVESLSQELVGTSRWLNAAGIIASPSQIDKIKSLAFVKEVVPIATEMVTTEYSSTQDFETNSDTILEQITIHNGNLFAENKISGKGVRIAVFDGGFKDADVHPAFKHLRDNNKIVKTWNFVKKKENVYEAHYHGRMVLSCIAGKMEDGKLLGLAPDAEFLLARTEVNTEPKKEEIWWVAALEWADQNGADIVNSSLGYGKQRYNLKNMDGKTSLVAKVANTAARKGILVCNSMGNEADDSEWQMLITPADADSILSVGAVYSISRIASFSSFGPTADGRLKPNVVAMGHNWVAGSNGNFTTADGTSFSSPMVAGFAACVKQLHPEYTAWQLKTEIEKSANHYPYFDYAFGYGIPQADYFFNKPKNNVKNIFTVKEDSSFIYIVPSNPKKELTLFHKITNGDNSIQEYDISAFEIDYKTGNTIPQYFYKNDLLIGQQLELWCDGQYETYKLKNNNSKVKRIDPNSKDSLLVDNSVYVKTNSIITPPDKDIFFRPYKVMHQTSLVLNFSFILPTMWALSDGNLTWSSERLSRSITFAIDNNWHIAKPYGLGFRIGFGSSWYAIYDNLTPPNFISTPNYYVEVVKNNIKITKFDLEFYQRFFLASTGTLYWYIDTGIFGEWNVGRRYKNVSKYDNNIKETFIQRKHLPNNLLVNKLDYGVRLRIGLTRCFAIFGQYRISNLLIKDPTVNVNNDLPKWEVGIQLF